MCISEQNIHEVCLRDNVITKSICGFNSLIEELLNNMIANTCIIMNIISYMPVFQKKMCDHFWYGADAILITFVFGLKIYSTFFLFIKLVLLTISFEFFTLCFVIINTCCSLHYLHDTNFVLFINLSYFMCEFFLLLFKWRLKYKKLHFQ